MLLFCQVERYELHKRSFTTVYDRLHTIYAPYTTVFLRITWPSITVVYLHDRVRRNTEKYGDRIRSVYARKRPYFGKLRHIDHDFFAFLCHPLQRWNQSTDQSDKMACDRSVYRSTDRKPFYQTGR